MNHCEHFYKLCTDYVTSNNYKQGKFFRLQLTIPPPQMTKVKNCCIVYIQTVFLTSVQFKPATFRTLAVTQTIELNYCSFMDYDLIILK